MGKQWKQWQTLFSWAPTSLQTMTAAMKLRCLLLGRKAMTNLNSILKSSDITLPAKVCIVKGLLFPVVTHGRELDHKEGWALKNWYFWNVVLEKTLESPVDCKEIKPVNSKWNQPWIFTGRTDVKDEAPTVWPPNVKSHSLEKTLILEKIEGKRRRGLRGWDGWMASSTQWIWVWTNSAR